MSVFVGLQLSCHVESRAMGILARSLHTTDYFSSKFPSIPEIISDRSQTECIERIKKFKLSPREPGVNNQKKAAVLIPLCIVNEELSLLYTLRRANLKRHRGQVSFPGGMEDPGDTCLEETALRETEEELGLERKEVEVWGSGSMVFGHEFTVQPFVGYLGKIRLSQLKPSPDEVDTVFTISLHHLCNPNNFGYTQFRMGRKGYTLPVFMNSEFRVWGITALMTHVFLSALLPNHYNNKLQYISPLKTSQ